MRSNEEGSEGIGLRLSHGCRRQDPTEKQVCSIHLACVTVSKVSCEKTSLYGWPLYSPDPVNVHDMFSYVCGILCTYLRRSRKTSSRKTSLWSLRAAPPRAWSRAFAAASDIT